MNGLEKQAEVAAKDIGKRAFFDPAFFCQYFLQDWFPPTEGGLCKLPWFQLGILALLTRKCAFIARHTDEEGINKIVRHFFWQEDPEDKKSPRHSIFRVEDGVLKMAIGVNSEVIMPRGFAKTTLCNSAVLWKICFVMRKHLVYVSESSTHAETQLDSIKAQLETNERLRSVFGDLKPPRNSRKKWTASFVQLENDVVITAKGRGSQIRGTNVNGQRPDEIILDDVEDDESVKTDDQRAKCRTWFYASVLPALPRGDKTATITALGTLLHSDALLLTLKKDEQFNSVTLGAIDADGDPLWDSEFGMTIQDIERKKRSYAKAGMLGVFSREFLSELRDEESAKFKEDYLRHDVVPREDFAAVALAIDPAISDKAGADMCAFAVVGMTTKGQIHVLEAEGKVGMSPREQVDKYFELRKRHGTNRHGAESNAYQKALVHLIREEMFRRGDYFEVEAIHNAQNKFTRVEGVLQPRYAAGYITHAKRFADFETQLLDWPNGKRDIPDAVAQAITLLDPYAAQAADPEKDLGEDEADELPSDFGRDEGLGLWMG